MEIYFGIISLAYFSFCILLIAGWQKIPVIHSGHWKNNEISGEMVSVIITVRNEAQNIAKLINDLSNQHYPTTCFEVIIVDDQSTDDTPQIIRELRLHVKFKLVYLISDIPENSKISPKKYALQQGINAAVGSIIITTDGDCRAGPHWISSMAGFFTQNPVLFVAGPVSLDPVQSCLDKFQTLDFASLIGTGAASIALGYPLMCNGANLAFRRNIYDLIEGQTGFETLISGDDVFLMQKIHRRFPGQVAFLKSPEALVLTKPQPDLKSFIHQRRRWAGKWHKYLFAWSRSVPVFIFLYHLSTLVVVILAFFSWINGTFILTCVVLRMLLEYLFLDKILFFQGKRLKLQDYFLAALIYPIYAVFFGILVNLKGFEWKGRKYGTDGYDGSGI